MAGSPIERLVDAVNWLEEELAALRELASSRASELMRLVDALMSELESEADGIVDSIIDEIQRLAEREVESIDARLDSEKARLARELDEAARANMDRAVEEVFKTLIERLGGAGGAG